MAISFGTDGWRAVISDTFTFENVQAVSQAIADAIATDEWEKLSKVDVIPHKDLVVVGYDTRFMSNVYAQEVARILAANGYRVMYSQTYSPTPIVSFAVKHLGAVAGVMITASHNAPRYNGIKVKAAYGGAALPEQCDIVEACLNANEEKGIKPKMMSFADAKKEGLVETFNPLVAYGEHIHKLINFDIIANHSAKMRIVVDSMYGSGRGIINFLLAGTGAEVNEIRNEVNPGFGGIHPEPIARYLGASAAAIGAGQGFFGLSTDGDADRTGAMDDRGVFVDPHKIMALSAKYLHEVRGLDGALVRTVSTTRMIDRIGKKYGLPVFETPVGFNHISDHMMERDVLIGGEESGGISFKGHIPEGDGIIMGLLMAEMISYANKPLSVMVDELLAEYGPAYYDRTDQRLARPVAKKEMIRYLTDNAPKEIGGVGVAEISTIDGVKYIMDDDSWLLIRPSGTEPVLRVYAEGRTQQLTKDLLGYGNVVAEAVK